MNEARNYDAAVQIIKTAILQSQYDAARSVNEKQLTLYYGIGKYISLNSRKGFWGKGAIDAISDRLQRELPGLRGFSARNLRNMRTFYEEWSMLEAGPTAAGQHNLELASAKSPDSSILAVATAKLPDESFWQLHMNKSFVDYVIQDYSKPMGVATYKTAEDMPEKLRKALPDVEDLRRILDGDTKGAEP